MPPPTARQAPKIPSILFWLIINSTFFASPVSITTGYLLIKELYETHFIAYLPVYFIKFQIYIWQDKSYVTFVALYGVIPIMLSLLSVGTHILPSTHAETSLQICVNGKCEIVSDYEGYHNKNSCINEDCSPDLQSNRTNHDVN